MHASGVMGKLPFGDGQTNGGQVEGGVQLFEHESDEEVEVVVLVDGIAVLMVVGLLVTIQSSGC